MLRVVIGDVDADFRHGLDGEWVDIARGFGPGAGDPELVVERGAEDSFGEVRAAAIAGAEDEDGRWFHEVG